MTTRPGYVWDATASEWVEIGQAAVVAPVAYQASEPVSPATGDIWIDSDDEVPSVDSTLYYRWTKTMSGGETSLSGTDNNSLALKYTPGYESVFINGVLQVRGSDYVATTGTTVTGLTALTASDIVMVESIVAYSVGDTYTQSQIDTKLGTGGWTSYTPTFTNLTVGSATLDFAYCQIGKTVHVRGVLIFGSGTTVTGNMSFSLPVTAISDTGSPTLGNARYTDSGTGSFAGFYTLSTGSVNLAVSNVAGTYPTVVGVNATVPFTWAINDSFTIYATYEAA